jgi:hypothetical protein
LLERFEEKHEPDPTTGCWVWTAYRTSDGYGAIGINRSKQLAHRVAYELFVGPIPEGLCLDHLCRNRACVNPQHLQPVTWGVNILRGKGAGAEHGRKTHCKNGHPFDRENTYTRDGKYRRCAQCQREATARYKAKKREAP